ncbi:hypothetical protein HY68_07505 [Streptomyces sp. AcH 505]|uniref:alpha/beta hydrolase n=1 Tax=Streptomyces sp. AcH 505 TaxID=352211 RepID=UPI000591C8DD|nr:hypothetical protein HY68_07505 [Streptomyces sp. AcH 505]
MDLASLKALKPAAYEGAADGYRATSDMASQAKDTVENQIAAKMRGSLGGAALEAAVEQLQALAEDFHYIQVECGLVSTALNAFASEVRPAQTKLEAALEDARTRQFTVGADGSVSYPAAGPDSDGAKPQGGVSNGTTSDVAGAVGRQAANFDPNPNAVYAHECADRIAEALQEATEADQKWTPQLWKLLADDDLTVSAGDWSDAGKDMRGVRKDAGAYLAEIGAPPEGGTPEDNAAWWKGLSAAQRADYLSAFPDRVGALDGLPADARDEANRTVLDETQGDYGVRLAAIPPEPPKIANARYNPEWSAWNAKYGAEHARLEAALKGMNAIQQRFDDTGSRSLPEAYLLGFDARGKGDGKVILANGNPDTADHTAIYVPGTGTNLEGIGGNLNRGSSLWRQSSVLAPGESISTITWFDYNAPDGIQAATHDTYAETGGPTLRQFLDGNAAAHQAATGGTAHTTLIGHSYGSTLIGDAAQQGTYPDGPLAADDVLVAGSPGMQADRAADLGVRPGHMWAMAGGTDDHIVRQGGRVMGLAGDLVLPTDPPFGANIMQSDAGDHGAFWDEHDGRASVSLENQARVVVGRYGDVTLEE